MVNPLIYLPFIARWRRHNTNEGVPMSLGRMHSGARRLAIGVALFALALAVSVRAAQLATIPSQLEVSYSTSDPSHGEAGSTSTESLAAQAAAGDQASDSATATSPAVPASPESSAASKSNASVTKTSSKSTTMEVAKPVGQTTLVEPVLKPNPMVSNGPNSHSAASAVAKMTETKPSPGKVNASSLADSMDVPPMPPEAAASKDVANDAAKAMADKPAFDDTAARAKDAAASVGNTQPLSTGARQPVAYLSPTDQYLVQPGDILQITVWKEEDLQREVLVRPDGGLSFPLAGDIVAAGRTVEQIQKDLSTRIENYIPEPVVTVAVKQVVGNRVYVVGRVNKPGEIIMGHELTVMQALSLAGGVTPFASLNSVHVLRRENGIERSIPFRYGDVEKGRNLSQNIPLQNGDVVVVP
jgi:polysaccharide export outer membrane protein